MTRLHGQAVKTSPFHGGNTGSIPVGVIFLLFVHIIKYSIVMGKVLECLLENFYNVYIWRSSQAVRQWSATPVRTGSNPVCAF